MLRRVRWWVLPLTIAFASQAAAQPVKLTWRAPTGCPSEAAVLREVTRLEGTHQPLLTELAVTVDVRNDATAWSAEMTTESNGTKGERTFSANDCQQLADAAALIIALAHCPELLDPEVEVVEAPRRESIAIGAFAATDVGSLVTPSAGAGLELTFRFDRWGAKVLALRTLSQQVLRGPSAIEVQTLAGLGARACWYAVDERFIVAPCVGVDGWLIQTTSSQVTAPSSGTGWWLGPVAGGLVGIRLFERLALTMSLEVGAAATRPVFIVDGYGQVHRPSEFVGRLRGGLEFRLW